MRQSLCHIVGRFGNPAASPMPRAFASRLFEELFLAPNAASGVDVKGTDLPFDETCSKVAGAIATSLFKASVSGAMNEEDASSETGWKATTLASGRLRARRVWVVRLG